MKNAVLPKRPGRKISAAVAGAALVALAAPAAVAQPSTQADPVKDGTPYYLTATNKGGRGVAVEAYLNWDYALLANDVGWKGDPVTFHKQDDGTYVIKASYYHWSGYDTWCVGGDGIYLDKESSCATHWKFVSAPGGAYYLKMATVDNYVTNPSNGKQWLKVFNSVLPGFREFTTFKPVEAK